MKIITWNCNGAFRKKATQLLPYKPDILVVPECEHPDKLKFPPEMCTPSDSLWFGMHPSKKGIGIFSFGAYRFKLMKVYNPNFRWVIPLTVTGGSYEITLFAVWTNNTDDKDGKYIEQVWKAIHYYDALLSHHRTVLVGDFNSNTIWDRPKRVGNHSDVVNYLEKKGIYSGYHFYYKEEKGKESRPTLYWQKNRNKPYHIDYCFVSTELLSGLISVEVGEYDDWIRFSDHVPLAIMISDLI